MSSRDGTRAPRLSLRTSAGTFDLGERPWLMGIVNATPDSFSDAGTHRTLEDRAAVAAGAAIVNDVSGLRDPGLADVCAETGAGLVLMHTRAAPKQKLLDPGMDGRMVADVE